MNNIETLKSTIDLMLILAKDQQWPSLHSFCNGLVNQQDQKYEVLFSRAIRSLLANLEDQIAFPSVVGMEHRSDHIVANAIVHAWRSSGHEGYSRSTVVPMLKIASSIMACFNFPVVPVSIAILEEKDQA